MEIAVYVLVFLTTFIIVITASKVLFYNKILIKNKLYEIKMISLDIEADSELKEPFIKRVVEPLYRKLVKGFGNAAPKAIKEKYENLILASGSGKKNTFNSVLLKQIIMMVSYGALIYLAMFYVGGKVNYVIVILAGALGFTSPLLLMYSKSAKRKEKIRKALPDFLDLLYVSVEAGLGLDIALKRSTEKLKGPLSEEIVKTLNEISKGRVREEALRGLANRTMVKELNSFVSAIIQTEQLGSDIANMLRVQSMTMRDERRQKAEEAAAKITVKMLFPLIFLMFPSLFVVILGPAIINIFESFTSGKW